MTGKKLSFLIFMFFCVGIFLTLGLWQIKRLQWKEGLIQQINEAFAHPQTITSKDLAHFEKGQFLFGTISGQADFQKSFYLSGQIHDGKPSKHLMIPLNLEKNTTILIDMGPDFSGPRRIENVQITGLLRYAPDSNYFTLKNSPEKNEWYSIDPKNLNIPDLRPIVLYPEKTPWKTFDRHKPEFRNDHKQYSIFWFTMAILTAALTIYSLRFSKSQKL